VNTDLATGIGRWLSEQRGRHIEIVGLQQVSAGARRINALFDAVDDDGHVERLALTALPTLDIQLLPPTVEAAVRKLAYDGGVPTPRIVGATDDPSYVGGPFFVSERVDGETIPRRVLRLVEQHGIGETVAAQLGTAMGRLHALDPASAPRGIARPAHGPVETALVGADTALSDLLQPSPVLSYGIRWLERHRPPEPARLTIVHSDIRNGNVIVGEDGLRAILDWEGTRIGDPAEDVAWPMVRMWRFRNDDRPVGGWAGVAPYRAAYEAAGAEWDEARVRWWLALGTLRWGLGLAGQARQHLDGSYRTIVMAASGRRVTELEYDFLMVVKGR
jgi:aminoglycoside phosphotransferase (APT) family kinase protein